MAVEAINLQSRSYTNQSLKRADYSSNTVRNNMRVENSEQVVQSEEKPVGIAEGVSLIAKGAVNKVKNMGKAILEHPARTIASVGAVSLAVAAAPLIGVSSAAAGAVLALGFAGYAVFETAKDVSETVKDNRAGRYNEVRQDLGEIGGDTVDLALSLPFVPKAANTLKNTVQYAPRVGINTNLINDLKSGEGIYTSFKKADIAINYETIANQMGIEVKPALRFASFKDGLDGVYLPDTGDVVLSRNYITPGGVKPKYDSSQVIAHELTHYQQYCDIARAQGVDGLKSVIVQRQTEILKDNGAKTTTPNADLKASSKELANKVKDADVDGINMALKKHYDTIDDAFTYNDALNRYNSSMPPELGRREVIDNMVNGDGSVFNSELYQKAIDTQGKIAEGSAEAAKANEYAASFLESNASRTERAAELAEKYAAQNPGMTAEEAAAKAFEEVYKTDIMEAEAFAAQGAYSHADYEANIAAAAVPMLSESEKEINSHSEDMTLKEARRYVHKAKFHRNI